MDDYELLDSGHGRKLERFGPYTLARPSGTAVWAPSRPKGVWTDATAAFDREGRSKWSFRQPLPDRWDITIDDLRFTLSPTGFGHVGIFPEQRRAWQWTREAVASARQAMGRRPRVLNLFAYSGGATLAAAAGGAEVCHLDASKGMTSRARENAALNGLADAPIRWIVDDVTKFLDREHRRGNTYHGIILDPPSFGRGKTGEVYKIEREIIQTLARCVRVLEPGPAFVLLSCHTLAFTPTVMHHLLKTAIPRSGAVSAGEMLLTGRRDVLPLPSGTYACWTAEELDTETMNDER